MLTVNDGFGRMLKKIIAYYIKLRYCTEMPRIKYSVRTDIP
jgi:hypothetical protein